MRETEGGGLAALTTHTLDNTPVVGLVKLGWELFFGDWIADLELATEYQLLEIDWLEPSLETIGGPEGYLYGLHVPSGRIFRMPLRLHFNGTFLWGALEFLE